MLVIYQKDLVLNRLALPTRRLKVLETPAELVEVVDTETEEVSLVEVTPAVFRDETASEQVERMITAGHLPDLPWDRYVVVPATHSAASAPLARIACGDWSGPEAIMVSPEPPAYLTAADIEAAKALVTAFADQLATTITGPVPHAERASWPTKEIAARAQAASTATPQQIAMLEAEAALTGETLGVLAAKIIANADTYTALAGMIAGQRRKTMAAIDALTVGLSVKSDLEGVLAAAKAEAEALLANALQS